MPEIVVYSAALIVGIAVYKAINLILAERAYDDRNSD